MKSFRLCFAGMWRMFLSVKGKVALSCVIGIVQVAASMTFVWACKHVVDIATGSSPDSFSKAVLFLVAVMMVQLCSRIAARYWEGYIVVKTQNAWRREYFAKTLSSTWTGKERFHSGDAVNRLEEDIRVLTDFLCVTVPDLTVTTVQLIAASVFLFTLAPSLAWVLVIIMPVAVLGSAVFFRKMRAITGQIRAGDSRVQGHIQENLQHRIVLKTIGAVVPVMEKLGVLQKEVETNTIRRLNYSAMARGIMQFGFMAGYATAFLWGAFGLRNGTVTYGLMVAFLQLVGQVQRPVADMTFHIPSFIKALSSEERLMELSEQPQEKIGNEIMFQSIPGVRLEDVTFSYDNGVSPRVIEHLSFDFKPGTMTAILGPTGAGKSTLVRIVMALLSPESGRTVLYADGREELSSASTRCNFMYVPQGNSLMSGTIRENLLLAKPDATDEQMREVLHLAAADFVFELPAGLQTSCAEVGAGLSEGQAQRIAVARALLRPGGILILDEATSALDAETEQALLERIGEHYKGRKTILCITHRPAATSYADSVLRLS